MISRRRRGAALVRSFRHLKRRSFRPFSATTQLKYYDEYRHTGRGVKVSSACTYFELSALGNVDQFEGGTGKGSDNVPINSDGFAILQSTAPPTQLCASFLERAERHMNEESNRAALCIFMEPGLEKELL